MKSKVEGHLKQPVTSVRIFIPFSLDGLWDSLEVLPCASTIHSVLSEPLNVIKHSRRKRNIISFLLLLLLFFLFQHP